jgi:RNA polymerase sigma-70 factor (ECF subfamily)
VRANDSDPAERFSSAFERSYGCLRAYAARRVGAEAAAETFLIAWRRIADLPDEPLPWLYGVARNVVLRHHASQARQDATRAALSLQRAPAGISEDDFPEVWAAWEQLSAADRELLALVAWEELSVREAAIALGCPAARLSVRLHRARKRFERALADPAVTPARTASFSEAA